MVAPRYPRKDSIELSGDLRRELTTFCRHCKEDGAALLNDFVPSAGPEIDGTTLWGSSSPKTLLLVARFS